MEAISQVLDRMLREACQLGRVLESHSFDYSPALLTQPPSHRDARRRDLLDAISLLDLQWARFEIIKVQIEDARNRLQQQRALCRSALSPISALPQEVFTEIFCHVLRHEPISLHDRTTRHIRALSQVCRDWRVVGLQLKHGWAFAKIQRLEDLPRLEFPMKRCGEEDFTLTVGEKSIKDMAMLAHETSEKLRRCLVDLEWQSFSNIESFFKHLKFPDPDPVLRLNALQRLAIRSPYSHDEIVTVLTAVDFPQLLSLELDRVWIQDMQTDALRNVRYITLSRIQLRPSILRICLENVPKLRGLQMRNCWWQHPWTPPLASRNIPSLEDLTMGMNTIFDVNDIVGRYTFPALCNLQVAIRECEHERPSFEDNHEHEVSLFAPTTSNIQLHSAIHQMSQLTTVSLRLTMSSLRAALSGLTPASHSTIPIATLVELEVIIPECICPDEQSGNCIGNNHGRRRARRIATMIVNMLEMRGCVKAPLKSLCVTECLLLSEPMQKMVHGPVRTKECRSCRGSNAKFVMEA